VANLWGQRASRLLTAHSAGKMPACPQPRRLRY